MLGILGKLAVPLFGIIDKAVKDKDLATQIKGQLQQQILAGDMKELDTAMQIIVAEARSDSWLTRSWRPITMLVFLSMLVSYWYGYAPEYIVNNPTVVQEVFSLIKIGLGGYVVSRGAEKTVPAILQMIQKRK